MSTQETTWSIRFLANWSITTITRRFSEWAVSESGIMMRKLDGSNRS